jgi:transcription antitermination factor NusG
LDRIDDALTALVEAYPGDRIQRIPAGCWSPCRERHRPRGSPALTPPRLVAAEGLTWVVVRTAHASERRVNDDLEALGLEPYCPMLQRYVFRNLGLRRRRVRELLQQPVFTRYLFVGLPLGRRVSRDSADRIEAVLHDSRGPLRIPARAITAINRAELAGAWDADKRPELHPRQFTAGETARCIDGPFADFVVSVQEMLPEDRIKALVDIFGRGTPVEFDACQLEKT